jgi:hypothetical protein
VINLEAWFQAQTYIVYLTLDLHSCLFAAKNTRQQNRFAARGQCVFKSSRVSFSVEGVGLPLRAVWIRGNLPASRIRSLIKVSLKSLCVTFAPQVAKSKTVYGLSGRESEGIDFCPFLNPSAHGESIRAGHFAAPRNNHMKWTAESSNVLRCSL